MPGTFFGPYGENNTTYASGGNANLGRFPLGHTLVLPDGRRYRFALNDGTVEVAGRLYQSVVSVADHLNVAADVARAIGVAIISATLGATLAAVDIYAEGMVHINDAIGEGYAYRIRRANTAGAAHAAAAASAVLTVNLVASETVQVALTTLSEMSFTRNRFHAVLIHPSPPTAGLAGVSPGVAAADRFYWSQVAGWAAVLIDTYTDAPSAVGRMVYPSITVDGAVGVGRLTFRTGGTAAGDVTSFTNVEDAAGVEGSLEAGGIAINTNVSPGVVMDPAVGVLIKANADTEEALVDLMIDGGS
jgi:hypothetical protein